MVSRGAKTPEMKDLQRGEQTSAATFLLENLAISNSAPVSKNWTFVLAEDYWQWTESFWWEFVLKNAGPVPIWYFIGLEPKNLSHVLKSDNILSIWGQNVRVRY